MIDYERLLDSLNYFGTVNNFSISQEYGSPPHYEIDVTPYDLNPYDLKRPQTITWNTLPDTRVLIKSILDKYDLNYIDTDMAATNEAFANHIRDALKKYILEGKKMPTGGYSSLFGNDIKFVPTGSWNMIPKVKKIIHSGPCTIVFWEDNTKTIVRLEEGKEYDEYAAFTAALAKKCYRSNSKVHKILETKTKRDLKEKIKNAKTVDLFPDIPEEKKKASREAAIKRRDGELEC